MKTMKAICGFSLFVLTGGLGADPNAQPTTREYTQPDVSKLTALRPYPKDNDVCQVIQKTDEIRNLVAEGQTAIACPKHESGAIRDRRNEGARIVGHAKHWTVFAVTNPL